MNKIRTIGVATAVAAGLLAPALAAAPALAQGGRPGVQATGNCTNGGTWKLKAKPDNGKLDVQFEVDTNVAGQVFTVKITDGATVVFKGTKTTAGPSGSFSVARLTANQAGQDTITAVARRVGNTCTGTVRI